MAGSARPEDQSGDDAREMLWRMNRLVAHVGPPKTATTYIQRALDANGDVLARHGVYLPRAGRSELAQKAVTHHHLAWELAGSPRFRPAQGGWDALADELADVDAETVLLSSEIFALADVRGVGDTLERRLRSLGRQVTVVFVVRDPLSLINSAYGQQVKTFETARTFDEHVAGVLADGGADLERQVSRWYQ